jgi:hypothetical protein
MPGGMPGVLPGIAGGCSCWDSGALAALDFAVL